MELSTEMMGAKSFLTGPQTLSSQHLNLGAWHGFQRVIIREKLQASSIEFKYSFPKEDFLLILLNYSDEEFDAIKIPSNPEESAGLFHVKYTGQFRSAKPFDLPGRKPGIWNTTKLKLEPGRVGISVNGNADVWMDLHTNTEQNIGFQSGINGVLLDDVAVYGASVNSPTFSESFDNGHLRGVVQIWLFLAVIFCSLIFALIARFFGVTAKTILSNLVAAQFSLIAGGVVISYMYLPVLSAKYPNLDYSMRSREDKLFVENAKKISKKLESRYPAKAPVGTLRIAVLGTSQTSGSGAARKSEGLVEQLEILLNQDGDTSRYECINFGYFGSWGRPLLKDYEKLAPQMSPDVCVINLSCNDGVVGRSAIFADNLKSFVEFNRGYGIETVFVKEAHCVDAFPDVYNHQIMQSVADELGVPVVEAHRVLGEHMDDGLLWWDFIHPTSFGHSLIAEAITETLQKEVFPKLRKQESVQK